MSNVIDQFMFPYQRSFAINLKLRAEQCFELIGAGVAPTAFLVGVAWPPMEGRHLICTEPENSPFAQSQFTVTTDGLQAAWAEHEMQLIFYGDEPTMRDKPENIRRLVVSEAIAQDLAEPSRALGMRSFVSTARPVEGYFVVAVIQAPEDLLTMFPAVPYRWMREQAEASLLMDVIRVVLGDAERAMLVPEPGRFDREGIRSAEELVRAAARRFMRIPFIANEKNYSDLFDAFNAVSRLMYEGAKGRGRMVLAAADDPNVSYIVKLAQRVPLRETRWVRKLLQMGSGDLALIFDSQHIHGLGRIADISTPTYSVDFYDQQQWDFRRGDTVLLRTRFGEPRLAEAPVSEARFLDNFVRLFPDAGDDAAARMRTILDILLDQPHGSMLVIAADAAAESERLVNQGSQIEPTLLSRDLLARASRIDGTILADPSGVCHAIGVILDGPANDACTPSRGARYNSAVRYVDQSDTKRLAFVISEDRTLDIIPMLRPRVSRRALEEMVTSIENATIDNYRAPRRRLTEHRFYLNQDQCDRINRTVEVLNEAALKEGQIVWREAEFEPNPTMSDEYLLP